MSLLKGTGPTRYRGGFVYFFPHFATAFPTGSTSRIQRQRIEREFLQLSKCECAVLRQVIYMKNLLDAVAAPSTCLNTSYSHDLVGWLNVTNTTTSAWWNTWMVFQVQYYDMPRQPGARIESPATLGRKCWAFAYLAQAWPSLRPKLIGALSSAGLNMDPFVTAYDAAVPFTLNICDQVMANCFVNATYDPVARNGTCPDGVGQFFVGFQVSVHVCWSALLLLFVLGCRCRSFTIILLILFLLFLSAVVLRSGRTDSETTQLATSSQFTRKRTCFTVMQSLQSTLL